nr:phenylalanine--tRNA ligase subunit alpha [Chloroflexota bacterium]
MTDLRTDLDDLRSTARERLAASTTAEGVDHLRHDLLGRSGRLTMLLRQLGSVPVEARPALGQLANEIRRELEAAIESRLDVLRSDDLDARLADEAVDMSAPGRP